MSIGTDTVRGKDISETESTLILPSSWCKPTLALVLKVLAVIFSHTIWLFSSHEYVKAEGL